MLKIKDLTVKLTCQIVELINPFRWRLIRRMLTQFPRITGSSTVQHTKLSFDSKLSNEANENYTRCPVSIGSRDLG